MEETRSLQRGPLVVRPLRRGTLPNQCGHPRSAQERLFSVNPQTYAEGAGTSHRCLCEAMMTLVQQYPRKEDAAAGCRCGGNGDGSKSEEGSLFCSSPNSKFQLKVCGDLTGSRSAKESGKCSLLSPCPSQRRPEERDIGTKWPQWSTFGTVRIFLDVQMLYVIVINLFIISLTDFKSFRET